MLLKVVLLCALSPVTMAADILAEQETQASVRSFDYSDGGQGWINHDDVKKGLDSFQEVSITHPSVISGGLYEQDNLSLDLLIKNNHLTRKKISKSGYQGTLDYPPIENDIDSYGLMNGEPYLFDTVADTIWQWDADLSYWNDLKASLNLPDGEYDTLHAMGEHYLLSMTDEVNNGLWEIGLTKKKLTDVSLAQDSTLFYTPQGLVQIYKNNQGIFEGQWLNANLPGFVIPLNYDDYKYVQTVASYSGTFIHLFGPQHAEALWLPFNEFLPSYIQLPEGTSQFRSCFSSLPKAFCVIKTEELGFALYELVQSEFILDTLLDSSLENAGITSIHAVGEHRFISTVSHGVNSKSFSLLSVDSAGTEVLLKAEVATDKEWYFIQPSRDPSVFYWVGREMGETNLYKAHVAGDLEFKRNVEPVEDLANQEGKNTNGADNAGENQDDDSENVLGLGSMPISISLFLLMFSIVRKTRTI